MSPVYVASQNGRTDVVDLLVQAGAEINSAETVVYNVDTHNVLFSRYRPMSDSLHISVNGFY